MAKKKQADPYIFNWYRFGEDPGYSCIYSTTGSDLHTHTDFYEFSMVTTGEYDNVYQDKTHVLTKNTLVFFKIGESHAIFPRKPKSVHFSFIIKPNLMEELMKHFFPHVNMDNLPTYTEKELHPIQGEYITYMTTQITDNLNREVRDHWMRLFFFEAFSACLFEAPQTIQTNTVDQCIDNLLLDFNKNLYLTYKVSRIYEFYPVSKSLLIKKFKERTGYTIVQYHTNKKLDYAAQLLSSSKQITITEVCAAIEYANTSHFARLFKERFHMNPREYQRAHAHRYHPSDRPVVETLSEK